MAAATPTSGIRPVFATLPLARASHWNSVRTEVSMHCITRVIIGTGILVAVGVAAPLAVWIGQYPGHHGVDRGVGFSPEVATLPIATESAKLPFALQREPLRIVHIVLDEMVIAAAPAPAPKRRSPSASNPAKRNCTSHRSQTFAADSLRVCDTPRSSNGMGRRLLAPMIKPRRLAPRDHPSPSGLIQEPT
jgi:hypothetical protein